MLIFKAPIENLEYLTSYIGVKNVGRAMQRSVEAKRRGRREKERRKRRGEKERVGTDNHDGKEANNA